MPKHDSSWRTFARESAHALRTRLDRLTLLTADDREQLSRRVEEAIASALEVPSGLDRAIEETAARLIARSRNVDPVGLAWDRTRERARRAAAIGAVTTIPAVLPGAGAALAALGLVTDWRYVAEQHRDLVLEIAALFGEWPSDPTGETRALFLAASATAFAAPGAGRAVTQVLARQIARRGIARLLPGAGAAVAGALNYIATIALGRAAIAHFGKRAGFDIHGIVPEEAHPAMPWLRNAIVDAIEAGRESNLFSEETRHGMAELSPGERDELIDLAAALSLARGRDPTSDPLVAWIGNELGFKTGEIARIIERARRSALPLRKKLNDSFARLIERSTGKADAIWRRVARLARPRRSAAHSGKHSRSGKRRRRK